MTTTTLRHKPNNPLNVVNLILDQIDGVVIVLSTLAAVGVLAALWRMFTGLGASTNLSDAISWGIWIAFDFSLIALAGCGFTMAGTVYVLRLEQFRPALKASVLAAFLGYVSVLVLLLIDLGRPDRFYYFLYNFNVHSPLFEICWCVLLYSCVLTLEVSPMIFERLNKPKLGHMIHRAIVPIAIAAVTLSSLHQSTLGTLYLNMPYRLHALWYTPMLPVLFFTSSVVSGLAMAILMYHLASHVSHKSAKSGVAAGLAKGLAGVAILYMLIRVADILLAGKGAALFAFDRDSLMVWFELVLIAIGPLILFLTPRLRNSTRGQVAGAGLAAFGVLVNRFDATLFAQTPPQAASYIPHVVEWASTIGILAGAALVWYLGVKFLSVIESSKAHSQH